MKKWISEICPLLLSHFNLDQTPFCKNEFVYGKPVRRKLHPIISPCKYEMFYRKGAVHLYHAAMRHSVKKTTPLKVDLVWSNCSRFIYHKEMNTTNMTFAAPSLQLRSNTFFHSYEFEYRKPVLNRRSRSFFQTGTFSKKKALSIHPVLQRTTLFKYWGCKNGSLNDSVDVFAFLYANCSTQCSLAIL